MAGIKVPKKSNKQKVNRKMGFQDPVFDGCERWTGQKYHTYVRRFQWLYYNQADAKDVAPAIFQWMKNANYDKTQISAAKRAKYISPNVAIQCRLRNLGMLSVHEKAQEYWVSLPGTGTTIPRPVDEYIAEMLEAAIAEGMAKKEEVAVVQDKKKDVYKPTIRQIMFEASQAMTEEIEEFVDDFIRNSKVDTAALKKFAPIKMLHKHGAKANHARIVRKFYESEQAEMQLILDMPNKTALKKMSDAERDNWEQIAEGYGHLSTAYVKASLEMYNKITNACDIIIAEQKVNRKPRKVKEKSADQIISKFKFKASDPDYGIASISPTKLLGGVCAVVFNTKNRKLGLYVASDSNGFGVRGTTLLNFNEETSLQKTIRKPLEVLPNYKKTTKAKAVKQFEFLKTTDIKLNGRFNSDVVLLAVFK